MGANGIVSENEQKIIEEADRIIAMEREKAHIRVLKRILYQFLKECWIRLI